MSTITNLPRILGKGSIRRAKPPRTEKFMGNATRVPNDALPKPPLASAGGSKRKVGRTLVGAVAGGAALGYLMRDEAKAPEATYKAPPAPSKASPEIGPVVKAPVSRSEARTSQPATTVAPSPRTGAPRGSQKASGASGKPMQGSALADYLGLSSDSAVRRNLRSKAGEAVSPKQASPLKSKTDSYRRKMSKG
jgi:hypothetical protein